MKQNIIKLLLTLKIRKQVANRLDESNIITVKSTELDKFSVFHFSVRID